MHLITELPVETCLLLYKIYPQNGKPAESKESGSSPSPRKFCGPLGSTPRGPPRIEEVLHKRESSFENILVTIKMKIRGIKHPSP